MSKRLDQLAKEINDSHASSLDLYERGFLGLSLLLSARTLRLLQTFFDDTQYWDHEENGVAEQKKLTADAAVLSKIELGSWPLDFGFDETDVEIHLERIGCWVKLAAAEKERLFPTITTWGKALSLMNRGYVTFWATPFRPFRWVFFTLVGIAALVGLYRHHKFVASEKFHGLIGEYFSDSNLRQYVDSQKDLEINFNWKRGGPSKILKNQRELYSMRWTGFLDVPSSGRYEISTRSDDGVRLWIGDQLLIDDWKGQYPTTVSTWVTLEKGLRPIKIEYFQQYGLASLYLSWRREDQMESEIIDQRYFYPSLELARHASETHS